MNDLIDLIRIKHWIKNLVIFAPIIFSGNFFNSIYVYKILITFFLFCLLSSLIYIFNDICDLKDDKKIRSKKEKKPLASGRVSFTKVYFVCFILSLIIFWILFFENSLILISSIFLVCNFSYSLIFKKIFILDIFFIAFSFLIRCYAGSIAIDVGLSVWMIITLFTGSIYLASYKRMQEIKTFKRKSRKVLKLYNLNMLGKIIDITAITTIIFYCLYIIDSNQVLFVTIPFIFYGFFRFTYLSQNKKLSESPVDILIGDRQLIVTIFAWLFSVLFFLYYYTT